MSELRAEFAYITSIELEKIRAFDHLKIDLSTKDGQRMLSVIIGRNGTCKSTLFRCIALGLCNEQDASALLANPGIRLIADDSTGSITLGLRRAADGEPGEIRLELKGSRTRDTVVDRVCSDWSENLFVCGYGAGRGNIGATQTRGYRTMDSVATLFDYRSNLVDNELMLRRLADFLGDDRYEYAMHGIRQALGLSDDHHIGYAKGGGVTVSGPGIGENIPLDAWADGYRLSFNWMIDLYGWAMQADAINDKGGIRGILLIDEVEQHLHPEMQADLLGELRAALPEMQIFATTHSPLTALGTESQNLIALHRRADEVYVSPVPSLAGYSVHDALVEESLFGTDPYPGYTRSKLDEHRRLSSVPSEERTKEQVDRMQSLAAELDPGKLPELRDDPIVQKLDEMLVMLQSREKKS